MKLTTKLMLFAGAATIAGQTGAAVMVLGSSRAAECYHAAEHERTSSGNVQTCIAALENDNLNRAERTATFVNLGILHFYRGEYDTALGRMDQAIENDPQEPEAVLNKAITLLRRDRAGTLAVPLFSRAIAMGTREPALAYYGRGLAQELEGDLTAAYLDIRRANQLDPDWDVPERDLARFIVEPAS